MFHLPRHRSRIQGIWGPSLVFLVLIIGSGGAGCSSESKGQSAPRAVPVVVGQVTQKSVPLQLRAIGNVGAYTTVSVKSLVGGEVVKVHFVEGQEVRRGDPLFTIDPRPLEAAVKQAEANLAKDLGQVKQAEANWAKDLSAVKQAEANLARDTSQAKNADVQAERYKSLVEKQVVAQQQYDQFRTSAEALDATLMADRAAIDNANAVARASQEAVENAKAVVQADRAIAENAKIQLGYCSICSPIDGRAGNILIDRGNIVKANDTPFLVAINQISPIYVTFSLPEKNLAEIRRYMAVGKLPVEAIIPNAGGPTEQGVLSFIDNAVDSTTGTIQVKGTFLNKEKRLWPGQFVNVVLTLTNQSDAVVVPIEAIQTGQQGQYVFVVKPDSTVESRPVVVERTLDHAAIIGKGLAPGETVVTDGQLQLVAGTKVEVKNSATAQASGEKPK
jgi:membrane fusion protein, multidrug efflux system